MAAKRQPPKRRKEPKSTRTSDRPRCGLCGKTANLTKTECCGEWICDDEHTYRLFSYARNSCHRNHSRYTLCGYHHCEGHEGRWQDCPKCRKPFETEMYVWYGTNEYNFQKLENPPAYKPTHCAKCKRVIVLGEGGYSVQAGRGRKRCQEPIRGAGLRAVAGFESVSAPYVFCPKRFRSRRERKKRQVRFPRH